jgi:hypothetical protein
MPAFSCKPSCIDCCTDVYLQIPLTLQDIMRVSSNQGLSITEFFDTALMANIKAGSDEVRAFMKMPCPYVDSGCTIHPYKPVECVRAPEDRIVFGNLSWNHCFLGGISSERQKEITILVAQQMENLAVARKVLYSPAIICTETDLVRNPHFRSMLPLGDSKDLVLATRDAVDITYRDQVGERFLGFETLVAKYGTVDEVIASFN